MSIEDGYFIGRALRGIDLTDFAAVRAALQSYEDPRKPHTSRYTPFLQRIAGDTSPNQINRQLALIEDW